MIYIEIKQDSNILRASVIFSYQSKELLSVRDFSHLSEVGARVLLNLGKKAFGPLNWEL